MIDTGAAVSVLPRSCANGTVDADSPPLVATNNSTITTYGTSKRIVDVGLKKEYSWIYHGFIVADVEQPILRADFLIHYKRLRDMRTGLAIPVTLSSIKLLSLNRIDSTRNELLKTFDNVLVWCDISTGRRRPYVTEKFRRKVFNSLHGLGSYGIR